MLRTLAGAGFRPPAAHGVTLAQARPGLRFFVPT